MSTEPQHKPSGHLKNMAMTAAGTSGSRVLGLMREQLTFAFFGLGPESSAFALAFQIPNLFRRLLGEGALTTALVPVMAQERKRGGTAQAFSFLNFVLGRVAPVMIAFSIMGMVLAWCLGWHGEAIATAFGMEAKNYQLLAARLTTVCMPYMPLICLAAIFTSALNMLGRFGLTALSAVWLNVSMILSLLIGVAVCESDSGRLYWLCGGAIIGGAAQLLVPAFGLWKEGWRPAQTEPVSSPEAWSDLRMLFIPAVIGAGVQQINLFLTRFFAFTVDERALAIYNCANRVVELPVGIFAVTVSTVIFPALAMHAQHDDRKGLAADLAHGLRLVFAINIGAALGMIVLGEPILRSLFQYGKFDAAATAATLPVLCIFACTIPFYAQVNLCGRALSAMKETRFQMRLAVRDLSLNAVAAPILGFLWGAPGLALANLLAVVYHAYSLQAELRRRDSHLAMMSISRPFFQCLIAASLMGVFVYAGWRFWEGLMPDSRKSSFLTLGTMVPAGIVIYFFVLKLFRYPEVDDLLIMFGKIRGKIRL